MVGLIHIVGSLVVVGNVLYFQCTLMRYTPFKLQHIAVMEMVNLVILFTLCQAFKVIDSIYDCVLTIVCCHYWYSSYLLFSDKNCSDNHGDTISDDHALETRLSIGKLNLLRFQNTCFCAKLRCFYTHTCAAQQSLLPLYPLKGLVCIQLPNLVLFSITSYYEYEDYSRLFCQKGQSNYICWD